MSKTKPDFLTVKQIAKKTGQDVSNVYRQVNAGIWGKVYNIGGIKIKASEYEKRKEIMIDDTIPAIPIKKLQREALKKKYLEV